jgi:hypothetical protein
LTVLFDILSSDVVRDPYTVSPTRLPCFVCINNHLRNNQPTVLFTMDKILYSDNNNNNKRKNKTTITIMYNNNYIQ